MTASSGVAPSPPPQTVAERLSLVEKRIEDLERRVQDHDNAQGNHMNRISSIEHQLDLSVPPQA